MINLCYPCSREIDSSWDKYKGLLGRVEGFQILGLGFSSLQKNSTNCLLIPVSIKCFLRVKTCFSGHDYTVQSWVSLLVGSILVAVTRENREVFSS